MKALVFGASGLIGSKLIEKLLIDQRFSHVTALVRKPLDPYPEGVELKVFDYQDWQGISGYFDEDTAVFCAVGTTRSKTPDYDQYRAIDLEIPVQIAALCAAKRGACCVIVSSLGANKESNNFYLKLKGEMEAEVEALSPPRYYFFRPSLLLGTRKEKRPAEWMGKVLVGAISPLFVGTLRKYKPVHAETVAGAMIEIIFSDQPSGPVEYDHIASMAVS